MEPKILLKLQKSNEHALAKLQEVKEACSKKSACNDALVEEFTKTLEELKRQRTQDYHRMKRADEDLKREKEKGERLKYPLASWIMEPHKSSYLDNIWFIKKITPKLIFCEEIGGKELRLNRGTGATRYSWDGCINVSEAEIAWNQFVKNQKVK